MAARKIAFFLNAQDAPSLLARARQLGKLQQVFQEIAPPQLAQSAMVGALVGGTLRIYADSGAVAAKLNQIAPRLVLAFQERGYEVTAIRTQAQAWPRPQPRPSQEPKSISRSGLENLSKLAARLSDSPLKSALVSLIASQRGRRRRRG